MASITDYLEAAIINTMRGTTLTAPAAMYVSLHSTATTDAGGGTELTGNGYSRQAITFSAPHATAGTTDNSTDITFSATGVWSTATHFAVWDASTAGNMWLHGALTATRTAGSGDDLVFSAGDLDLTVA